MRIQRCRLIRTTDNCLILLCEARENAFHYQYTNESHLKILIKRGNHIRVYLAGQWMPSYTWIRWQDSKRYIYGSCSARICIIHSQYRFASKRAIKVHIKLWLYKCSFGICYLISDSLIVQIWHVAFHWGHVFRQPSRISKYLAIRSGNFSQIFHQAIAREITSNLMLIKLFISFRVPRISLAFVNVPVQK